MWIEMTRTYIIQAENMSAASFIEQVDRRVFSESGEHLPVLIMANAVAAAADLFDGGDLTSLVSVRDDNQFAVIDCPDHNTQLELFTTFTGRIIYRVIGDGDDEPTPYDLAREQILQGRHLIVCNSCKAGHNCYDNGQFRTSICETRLNAWLVTHFNGFPIVFTDIDNYPKMITMPGFSRG